MRASKKRKISPTKAYDQYIDFSTFENKEKTLMADGNVFDTLDLIEKIVKEEFKTVSALARRLKGQTVRETSKRIFDFVYRHIQYTADHPTREQLHSPARIWKKRFHGIDCDDYTIFISAILMNLGISHAYRMVKINGKSNYQHVYPVVFEGNEEIIIDPVLDIFDTEYPYDSKHDKHVNMEIEYLNGIEEEPEISDLELEQELKNDLADLETEDESLEGLNGDEDEEGDEDLFIEDLEIESELNGLNGLNGSLVDSNADFGDEFDLSLNGLNGLEGTKEITPAHVYSSFYNGLKKNLENTVKEMSLNLNAYSSEDKAYYHSVRYVLAVWHDPRKRSQAINNFANGKAPDKEDLQGLGDVGLAWGFFKKIGRKLKASWKKVKKGITKAKRWIGRTAKKVVKGIKKAAKWVWKKIKQAGKWVWKNVIKPVVKFIMKWNPLSMLARGGVLLWFQTNLGGSASRIGLALIQPSQANKIAGKEAHRKAIKAYKGAYNVYVNILQGSQGALNSAIKKGYKKANRKNKERYGDGKFSFNPIKGKMPKMSKAQATRLRKSMLKKAVGKSKNLSKYRKKVITKKTVRKKVFQKGRTYKKRVKTWKTVGSKKRRSTRRVFSSTALKRRLALRRKRALSTSKGRRRRVSMTASSRRRFALLKRRKRNPKRRTSSSLRSVLKRAIIRQRALKKKRSRARSRRLSPALKRRLALKRRRALALKKKRSRVRSRRLSPALKRRLALKRRRVLALKKKRSRVRSRRLSPALKRRLALKRRRALALKKKRSRVRSRRLSPALKRRLALKRRRALALKKKRSRVRSRRLSPALKRRGKGRLRGLGFLGAAATAASGAAASGFIAKIWAFIKSIGKFIWKGVKWVGKKIGKVFSKKAGGKGLVKAGSKSSKALAKLKASKAGKLVMKGKSSKVYKLANKGIKLKNNISSIADMKKSLSRKIPAKRKGKFLDWINRTSENIIPLVSTGKKVYETFKPKQPRGNNPNYPISDTRNPNNPNNPNYPNLQKPEAKTSNMNMMVMGGLSLGLVAMLLMNKNGGGNAPQPQTV